MAAQPQASNIDIVEVADLTKHAHAESFSAVLRAASLTSPGALPSMLLSTASLLLRDAALTMVAMHRLTTEIPAVNDPLVIAVYRAIAKSFDGFPDVVACQAVMQRELHALGLNVAPPATDRA